MQPLEMPVNGYYFFLKSIPCDEPLLLPRHTVSADKAAEEYSIAREQWLDKGWAELDFSGSLSICPDFARLRYDLSHMNSVLRWERQSETEYFVKGPVDLIHVVEADGEIQLRKEKNVFLLRYFLREYNEKPTGTITVKRFGDGKSKSEALHGDTDDSTENIFAECLSIFYGDGNDA